ncbi:MAG TPA: hypothetical protein VMR06_11120 [Dokdonella sp.]|uniref:hypothetical protein n=1 Tax=Dokdonella sp. TaxID=2291710 RepID=UPI002C8C9C45|nr:hypothetical protein [Dokdonella sp.]HUD42529.1 hypothetical protein [Dokdonella sp.]
MNSKNARVLPLASTLLLVGILTFIVHEFAHWLAGTLLGYPMRMTPNQAHSTTPMLPLHESIMSAAGPLATYAQAAVGYWLVTRRSSLAGFALVYMAFFMRLVAMGVSMFHPNDEARISLALGLGLWTLPALAVAALFVLVVLASRRMRIGVREQLVCYLAASVVVTVVVGVDALWFKST